MAGALLCLAVTACSGDDGSEPAPTSAGADTTTSATAPPSVPGLTVQGPIVDGDHGFPQTATPVDLAAAGYLEEEFFLQGEATSYRYAAPPGEDGVWEAERADTAPYTTRVLVRRPEDPDTFNGTVVVEWLNVSSGVDVDVDFGFLAEEILREGTAWVGVTAQEVAVTSTGGGQFGAGAVGLQAWDPERYGELDHPGDAYSYDIFSQAGAVLRATEGQEVLGGLVPDLVLADGESQSAFRMATYINAVDPLAHVYDGFLVHSRDGGAAPRGDEAAAPSVTGLRTDGDAPVLQVITETDLFSLRSDAPFPDARQPDGDRVRTWEQAGTAHADATYLSRLSEQGQRQFDDFLDLTAVIPSANDGPQTFLMRAGLRALRSWAVDGTPPPTADPIEVADGAVVRDRHGNARGGIRTPLVDVPAATLTGEGTPLIGSTTRFSPDQLRSLYGSRQAYLDQFETSAEAAVDAGFVLEEDLPALLDEAEAVDFG